MGTKKEGEDFGNNRNEKDPELDTKGKKEEQENYEIWELKTSH